MTADYGKMLSKASRRPDFIGGNGDIDAPPGHRFVIGGFLKSVICTLLSKKVRSLIPPHLSIFPGTWVVETKLSGTTKKNGFLRYCPAIHLKASLEFRSNEKQKGSAMARQPMENKK